MAPVSDRELRELLDRDQIRQLMYKYAHCWDNLDHQGWVDCFLAGEGVCDFDQYRVDPTRPLLADLFVPDSAKPPPGVSLAPLTQGTPKT